MFDNVDRVDSCQEVAFSPIHHRQFGDFRNVYSLKEHYEYDEHYEQSQPSVVLTTVS